MYRGRVHTGGSGVSLLVGGGAVDQDWEEQVVETVNNTINHMVIVCCIYRCGSFL